MNILSNSLHLPELGHVTILEKDCRLVSLPLPTYSPEGLSSNDLSDTLSFINTQKLTANSNTNTQDFVLTIPCALPQTNSSVSSLQDVATNTSLSMSGVTDTSPFVETDDNPWKRAWIAFRSGKDLPSLLNKLSFSLLSRDRQTDKLAGKSAFCLSLCISFCQSFYRLFSPQIGFGLSVSQQLEMFSSLTPAQHSSIHCIAWHPYLSLLALAVTDHTIQLQNLHTPDCPLGSLRHRYQKSITCMQFSRVTGTQLAVGCIGGILVWLIEHSALLQGSSTHPTKWYPYAENCPVLSLAWSPKQALLAACSSATKHILLIDTPTGQSQPVSRMLTRGICLLEWSPDGSKLLAASCGASFRVWSADTWTPELWDGMSDRLQTAKWSPDGSLLIFAIRNEPYLYSLAFSGSEGMDTSIREGVGGSKSAVKCVDLIPMLCTGNGGTQMEIGGSIQDISWDSKGERLVLLFSPEATQSAQELVLVMRTKVGPILTITPVGFIRGPPNSIPLLISFRPRCESGATLLVVWNSGYVSLIPFDYTSRTTFENTLESHRATSTPVFHSSNLLAYNRQHNTPHPILFSPVTAKSSPLFS